METGTQKFETCYAKLSSKPGLESPAVLFSVTLSDLFVFKFLNSWR